MRLFYILFLVVFAFEFSIGQSISDSLKFLEIEREKLNTAIEKLDAKIVDWKQKEIIKDLIEIGLPSNDFIKHHALILEYSETHEQAKWVSHIISPEIKDGHVFRTNDFRIDPKVESGTAVQEDYFLSKTLKNGEIEYDGFGYDRGHLAPSADFRWSPVALSESFFYSNMSPQLPKFNREKWAELENHLRSYVVANEVPLYIVTIPILEDGLPKIERSINGVSIPKRFAKAVYDPIGKTAIGFIMENKFLFGPLESYAVTIDELEEQTGLNVFSNLSEEIESSLTKEDWFENLKNGDKEPLSADNLPKNCFNTAEAKRKIGKKTCICGHVVNSRYSRKGNLWLNIDRQFPNQVFSVFIRKKDLANFDYDLKNRFDGKSICVRGKIENFSESPSITLEDQNSIALFVQEAVK